MENDHKKAHEEDHQQMGTLGINCITDTPRKNPILDMTIEKEPEKERSSSDMSERMWLNYASAEQNAASGIPRDSETIDDQQKELLQRFGKRQISPSRLMIETDLLDVIVKAPLESDVICGRGKGIQMLPGNLFYHRAVNERRVDFAKGEIKLRREIAKAIVLKVRARDPPGRFLKGDEKLGVWVDIGNEEALKKTLQSLREGVPKLLQEIVKTDNSEIEQVDIQEYYDQKIAAIELEQEDRLRGLDQSMHSLRDGHQNEEDLAYNIFNLIKEKKWESVKETCEKIGKTISHSSLSNGETNDVLLPIHYACEGSTPLFIIELLHNTYPKAVQMKDKLGSLPIHIACGQCAFNHMSSVLDSQKIQYLCQVYPEGAGKADKHGHLPLHIACLWGAPINVIKCLYFGFPGAVRIQDKFGNLPLHWACLRRHKYSDVIEFIKEKYPEGKTKINNFGHKPTTQPKNDIQEQVDKDEDMIG